MAEESANPLLLGWLKEWMDEAQSRNSKGYTVYKKAYQSMKACPLKFHHPCEAQQLNGLGPKLCDRLAEKLKTYCKENGLPMPEKVDSRKRTADAAPQSEDSAQPTAKTRKVQPYVPKLRSGPYALIMALGMLDREGSQAISKNDLIDKAQPLCDSSFTAPTDPTKFFTAWNSMKTLESKELVCTKGHPGKKYYLSDEGWEVALRMKGVEAGGPVSTKSVTKTKSQSNPSTANLTTTSTVVETRLERPRKVFDISELSSSPSRGDDNVSVEPQSRSNCQPKTIDSQQLVTMTEDKCFILLPNSFEVKLVLDTREIRSTTDRDYIATELRKHDIDPIIRSLPLGDVLWIATIKQPYVEQFKTANIGDDEEGNIEIVLEHIMERKRLDDLIGSIKDGRFHEQKFRLRKSGIKHITYLVEEYSISAEKSDKYGEAVDTAMATLQMVNNIFVKQTSKLDHTIRYLARMTRQLRAMYEAQEIHTILSQDLEAETYLSTVETLRNQSPDKTFGLTFSAFRSLCDKSDSMTLRDVFLKMLMCTRGVTGDKAIEIQKIWPTPRALIEAYEARGDAKSKESLISEKLSNAIPRKKVAKALSSKIAEVWT